MIKGFVSNRQLQVVVFLTIFAGILRFYNLAQNPPSLNLDEVAIGFNANSILKTGQDEYGTTFPIAFRSHDDYKAPFYIYLTSVSIFLFGLGEFSVRFPSALLGTFTIPLTYLLVQQLFSTHKNKDQLSTTSSLLLAISPWHLQFSRAAFETNVAVFFTVLGIWAYLKGRVNRNYWFITATSFALSIYTYHTAKLFIPLFTLLLIYHSRSQIKKHFSHSLSVAALFIILVSPLIPYHLTPESRLRFKGTSVFETPTLVDSNHEQKIQVWREGHVVEAFLFHDERFAAALTILKGYFSHVTFSFLFLGENGPPRNLTPNVGLLYLWELPTLIIGAYTLFRQKSGPKSLIFSWIILIPIASALTWDAPSSTRTTLILPTLQIISAIGLVALLKSIKPKAAYLKHAAILVVLFFFLHYLHNYHRIAPIYYADAWQYGYKQAVEYAHQHTDEYDQIVVSTELKQPQNFFAFHSDYDPGTYIQVDGGTVSGGFNESKNKFGPYQFKNISWEDSDLEDSTLYIDLSEKTPERFGSLKTIYLPTGEPKITITKKDIQPWEQSK